MNQRLSKIWPTTVTIILSIMIETLVHVYDMMSVWEMLPFLIMEITRLVSPTDKDMRRLDSYLI
jgi:hypothetical protein